MNMNKNAIALIESLCLLKTELQMQRFRDNVFNQIMSLKLQWMELFINKQVDNETMQLINTRLDAVLDNIK